MLMSKFKVNMRLLNKITAIVFFKTLFLILRHTESTASKEKIHQRENLKEIHFAFNSHIFLSLCFLVIYRALTDRAVLEWSICNTLICTFLLPPTTHSKMKTKGEKISGPAKR